MSLDSACGSTFSDSEEYEIDMPSIRRCMKESFYHKYNNGKYLSSYDYFSKPPSTYYVANQNGELSKEILGTPMINENVKLKNICIVNKKDIEYVSVPSSPMSDFFKNEEFNEINISFGFSEQIGTMFENKWLTDRGVFGIYGHIILFAKCNEKFIPSRDAIRMAEDVLQKDNQSIIKKLNHISENKKRLLNKCNNCKKMTIKYVNCHCNMRKYCSIKCMSADSKTHHATRIHTGVFL